jgi:hypothetical protein
MIHQEIRHPTSDVKALIKMRLVSRIIAVGTASTVVATASAAPAPERVNDERVREQAFHSRAIATIPPCDVYTRRAVFRL